MSDDRQLSENDREKIQRLLKTAELGKVRLAIELTEETCSESELGHIYTDEIMLSLVSSGDIKLFAIISSFFLRHNEHWDRFIQCASDTNVLTAAWLKQRDTRFNDFTAITAEAAAMLSSYYGGGDSLNGITQLSVEAAKHLALGGPLSLRGIQSLPEDIAATFTEHKEELNMGGLTELSDVAAESLGKHQGHSLILDGLKELSDAAAESLGKHQGSSLNLNGLQELSDAAAKCLGKHHGKSLNLNGLKYLSDAASASLTGHSGKLWLDGLSGLSDAAALSFSRYQGRELSLNGLTSLSDSAAENLGKREGTSKLSLQGLENLSDAAALALENKLIQLPSHITKQINLIIKRIATAESLLTREQQSKIRKLIKTNDGDNLAIACELLTVAAASEGDWIKLFPKTRIKELLNSWEPGVWNTLATAFKEFPRLDEMLTIHAADRVYGRLHSNWDYRKPVIDGREVVRMNANDDVIELLKRARRL